MNFNCKQLLKRSDELGNLLHMIKALIQMPLTVTALSAFEYCVTTRFRWRRRLFVISAPDDEEWSYQQQLYSLASQACNLGELTVSSQSLMAH